MYSVDLDHLADTVRRLDAVESELSALDRRLGVDVLRMGGCWAGAAAVAHQAAHQRWDAAHAELREALLVMRAAGDTAHVSYSDAVAANRLLWQQVR